jgi:RND family efflux transporter MFP subunit
MQHNASHSPLSEPHATEAPGIPRKKAPLVGIIGASLLALMLAGWTGMRIIGATQKQTSIAAQRNTETEKNRALSLAPADVSVVTPVARTWQPEIELDGTLFPGQSAELGFKIGGKLVHIGAKVGDTVRAGTLLGVLDSDEAQARLDAAHAQVRAANAELALADDSERRTSSMVTTGSMAEAAGVQTAQKQALARAQADSARAQAELLRVSLESHRLVAPFAGSVTRAPDGVGGVVNAGDTKFEIVDLSLLKLKGTLGENDAALVKPGATIDIDTEQGHVTGKVTTVLGSVDNATRRVRVEASIDNRKEPKLRAGSFVRANIRTDKSIAVLELPPEVLRPGGQDEVVVVAGNSVVVKRVTYSVDKTGKLLVRHGLDANDRVIVSPKPELEAGKAVNVLTAEGKAP